MDKMGGNGSVNSAGQFPPRGRPNLRPISKRAAQELTEGIMKILTFKPVTHINTNIPKAGEKDND